MSPGSELLSLTWEPSASFSPARPWPTSLVEGESVAKMVAVLEIAGSEFRVRPVRLANVRGFKTGTVNLNDPDHGLDVEDPKIDDKVTNLLEMRVKELIQEARDGMVEQEDESATMKVSEVKFATSNQPKTLFRRRRSSRRSTSRNLNRKRILPKKRTTKSSKESRSTRSRSR